MGAIYSEPVKYTVSTQTTLTPNQLQSSCEIPAEVVRENTSNITNHRNAKRDKCCSCFKQKIISPNDSSISVVEKDCMSEEDQSQDKVLKIKTESDILCTKVPAKNNSSPRINVVGKTIKQEEVQNYEEETENARSRIITAQPKFSQCTLKDKRNGQILHNSKTTKQGESHSNLEQHDKFSTFSSEENIIGQEKLCIDASTEDNKMSNINDACKTTIHKELPYSEEENGRRVLFRLTSPIESEKVNSIPEEKKKYDRLSQPSSSLIPSQSSSSLIPFSKKISITQEELYPHPFTGQRNIQLEDLKVTKPVVLYSNLEQNGNSCSCSPKGNLEKTKQGTVPTYNEENENICKLRNTRKSFSEPDFMQRSLKEYAITQLLDNCKTYKEAVMSPKKECEKNYYTVSSKRKSIKQEQLPQLLLMENTSKLLENSNPHNQVEPCSNLEPEDNKISKINHVCKTKYEKVQSYEDENGQSCLRKSISHKISQHKLFSEIPTNYNGSSNINASCEISKLGKVSQYVERDTNLYVQQTISKENLSEFQPQENRNTELLDCTINKRGEAKLEQIKENHLTKTLSNCNLYEIKESLSNIEQDMTISNCSEIQSKTDQSGKIETNSTSLCSINSEINKKGLSEKLNQEKLPNEFNQGEILKSQIKKEICCLFYQNNSVLNLTSNTFEVECLNEHNNFRGLHNCPPLELSLKLSELAKNWAINISRSKIIRRDHKNKFGENMYISVNMNITGRTPVQSWYNEISEYDFKNPGFHPNTGHFTQVIWKNCRQIGVGMFTKDKSTWVVVYYNPPGNLMKKFKWNVPPLAK